MKAMPRAARFVKRADGLFERKWLDAPVIAAYDAAPADDPKPGILDDETVRKIMEMFAAARAGQLDETNDVNLEELLRGKSHPDHMAGDSPTPANPGLREKPQFEAHLADDSEESLKFLKGKLSGADWKAYDAMRKRAYDARRAADEPPPFAGRPTVGGEPLRGPADAQRRAIAADAAAARHSAAEASFAERFPNAARVSFSDLF